MRRVVWQSTTLAGQVGFEEIEPGRLHEEEGEIPEIPLELATGGETYEYFAPDTTYGGMEEEEPREVSVSYPSQGRANFHTCLFVARPRCLGYRKANYGTHPQDISRTFQILRHIW